MAPLLKYPLTEAALNGLKSGVKGFGFVTARAIAIVSTLVCALLCDSAGLAAESARDRARACGRGRAGASVATDMRIGGDDKQTRFVVDLNRKIDLAAFTLADPYRVVVDLPQMTFKLPAKAGDAERAAWSRRFATG